MAERAQVLCELAAAETTLARRIWTLWRVEGLVFAVADRDFEAINLGECELPAAVGPPAHCGLAMAAVFKFGFDPKVLTASLVEKSDPRFLYFAIETLGLMLAAYEPGLFSGITGFLGRAGLMRRYRVTPCQPADFMEHLAQSERHFAGHGYGRLIYFKSHRLPDAVKAIAARPFLPFGAAVRGALAAYILVNSADLDRILTILDGHYEAELGAAIAGAVENVLKLLEWSVPGCLGAIDCPPGRGGELLASAVAQAEINRNRGEGPGLVHGGPACCRGDDKLRMCRS